MDWGCAEDEAKPVAGRTATFWTSGAGGLEGQAQFTCTREVPIPRTIPSTSRRAQGNGQVVQQGS